MSDRKELEKPVYRYDGKRVAIGVWALFILYGFATVDPFSNGVKGWLHVLLYSASSGLILLAILAVTRERID